MDFLDILNGRYNMVCTGNFYEELPKAGYNNYDNKEPIPFDYEIVTGNNWTYKHLIQNLIDTGFSGVVIKTHEEQMWRPKTYCTLQDGKLYIVVDVRDDYANSPKDSMRILPFPVEVEKLIMLKEIENPWGLV